jgi:uncharacterized protein (UPF0248 family)
MQLLEKLYPMLPIHKLLSRIQWDEEFGRGDFVIGYYDRMLGTIIRVPFAEVILTPGNRNAIQVMDYDGVIHSIPLHRIKEVYKDRELIWRREH